MASIKSFETFISEMDRSEEIEDTIETLGEPEDKDIEEVEDEADEVQEAEDATPIGIKEPDGDEEKLSVYSLLEKCYEEVKNEAKVWESDAHDDHTIETYMVENAALVAGLAVNALTEMKDDMQTEAFEACLNRMSEAYAKKINEMKETKNAIDAEDI